MEQIERESQRESQSQEKRQGHKRGRFFRVVAFFLKATTYYFLVTFFAVLVIAGSINIYDVIVPDDVPEISVNIGNYKTIYEYPGSELARAVSIDSEYAWAQLQPALQILDTVCPEASTWARQKHKDKDIVWSASDKEPFYAQYEPFKKVLTINKTLFELKNAERACTIAHEFRHSRQNLSKPIKATLSFLITGIKNDDIVETDARYYESKVRESIYRW